MLYYSEALAMTARSRRNLINDVFAATNGGKTANKQLDALARALKK